jgi:hypothetical protein
VYLIEGRAPPSLSLSLLVLLSLSSLLALYRSLSPLPCLSSLPKVADLKEKVKAQVAAEADKLKEKIAAHERLPPALRASVGPHTLAPSSPFVAAPCLGDSCSTTNYPPRYPPLLCVCWCRREGDVQQ